MLFSKRFVIFFIELVYSLRIFLSIFAAEREQGFFLLYVLLIADALGDYWFCVYLFSLVAFLLPSLILLRLSQVAIHGLIIVLPVNNDSSLPSFQIIGSIKAIKLVISIPCTHRLHHKT